MLSARILRRGAVKRVSAEVAAYIQQLGAGAKCPMTVPLLHVAQKIADSGDVERGWRYLQTARRLELAASGSAEIDAAATTLREEADKKLTSWRKEAIKKLLVKGPSTPGPAEICEAAWIRDEHSNNEAYKGSLFRASATWLVLCLLLAGLLLALICRSGYLGDALKDPGAPDFDLSKTLASFAVFGFLGAVISALTDLFKAGGSARIPELTSTFRIMLLRVLMGPASAVILFFVLQTDLAPKILHAKGGYIVLVAAFAAGFSERLVLRAIEALDRKSSD